MDPFRGRHHASRSVSPDPFADRYDPDDAPSDPIAMQTLSAAAYPSPDLRRGPSPGASPQWSPEIGLSFPRGGHSYEPVRSSLPPTDSRTMSLYSTHSLGYHKTKDQEAQQLVDRRAGEIAEWKVHWITPVLMIALFVAGVAAAVGHHFFYLSLEGKPATDQLIMVRYGTALAFFVKSALVGSIVMCYRQRIWHTLRTRALTIAGIDGLFSATEDPTQFFYNGEMMINAKIATVMAICSWLIPIASVLSPGSLTSEMTVLKNATDLCPQVATLNFAKEAKFDFRGESSYVGSSLVYYNTTNFEGEGDFFDYYDRPSQNAKRLVFASMYLKEPAANTNASINSCGEGFNCTYEINFEAPGYKCDLYADSDHADAGDAPFSMDVLAPKGDNLYFAVVDQGDYKMPQTETGAHGIPIKEPYPDSLGVFDVEPTLWIGYVINTHQPWPANAPEDYKTRWGSIHEPKLIKCIAYHTNYTFQIEYRNSKQNYTRIKRDFLRPVVDTTFTADAHNSSEGTASPSANFVSPKGDVQTYKRTAAYHAIMQLLRNFLGGSVSKSKGLFVTSSDISETKLMDAEITYPQQDLPAAIQGLFEDILISLLSDPRLIVADTQAVPCTKDQSVNVYKYKREGLWIGYAFAVAGAFVCLVVGGWAIHQNGVASDTLFSRILVTTRNPTLDRLSVGACLGGDPFPKELTRTKLRFGVLLEENPREGPLGTVEHCTFGAVGETKPIVKFGTYAGLKKYRRDGSEEQGGWDEKEPLLEKEGLRRR
ncbi:hypothetical protein DPSP01_001762 [Paraphaeosphaeria sporulosa]|uniref:Uncharacterized protein n=1 Tax=Paraphaeosphaeria sporulosa TaxID=1460663 RepID=A0A177CSQ4_9PLEO|nr:uncharacterized protein CC84DRAFT_1161210 [Paraphaeosphaeria sporulosa]OAG10231.1 hypothetical protein CC84DRAFT_1161210 [Paraphaeosphaeria sporulosa]